MPILRKGVGDYQKVETRSRRMSPMQRQADDFDLAFSDHKVYVIDDHEWFDPHTSTKYDGPNGISRHAMHGPSVIVTDESGGGMKTTEYHINDPVVWTWLRRCIKEGHMSADTMPDCIADEKEIQFTD